MDSSEQARFLAALIEQHYALLYRLAYRLSGSVVDAEDLTQQTFLTAQTQLQQLRSTASAKAWLCTILRNLYLQQARRQATVRMVPLVDDQLPVEEPELPTGGIHGDELQAALDGLPDEFRIPLILFYFDEFSYQDIAEQLDLPIGTVMSRLSRAKSHVRRRLESPASKWVRAEAHGATVNGTTVSSEAGDERTARS